jgi:hypothetical protein
MLVSVQQQWGHVIFIGLCLIILGVRYILPFNMYQDDRYSNDRLVNRESDQRTLQDSFSNQNELVRRREENSPGGDVPNKGQKNMGVEAHSPEPNITERMEEWDVVFDVKGLPSPEIEFMGSMLAGWDREAEKLISEDDFERLVDFKIGMLTGIPKKLQSTFLKSDCAVSLKKSSLAQSDPNISSHIFLQHYKASLEALHRLDPEDPLYFFGKSLVYLRDENDPNRAMDTAQEGLTILRARANVTIADIYYDWVLTQTKAMCFSASDRNKDAIKVITECQKRMAQLPAGERGLVEEIPMALDVLQNGEVFSRMVYRGKVFKKDDETE